MGKSTISMAIFNKKLLVITSHTKTFAAGEHDSPLPGSPADESDPLARSWWTVLKAVRGRQLSPSLLGESEGMVPNLPKLENQDGLHLDEQTLDHCNPWTLSQECIVVSYGIWRFSESHELQDFASHWANWREDCSLRETQETMFFPSS